MACRAREFGLFQKMVRIHQQSKEKSDLIRLVSPQHRKVIEPQCGNGLDGTKPEPESS